MFKGFSKSIDFSSFPSSIFGNNARLNAYGFFDPSIWLDPSLLSIPDMTQISEIFEKARNKRAFQNTFANQPRYKLSNSFFNGHPTIDTSNNSSFLNLESEYMGKTCVFVGRHITVKNVETILGNSFNTQNFLAIGGIGTGISGPANRFKNIYYSATTENTDPKIVVLTNNGIFVNGVKEYFGDSLIGNSTYNRLFDAGNAPQNRLNGDLAELIFFDYDFSDNDSQNISNSINQKYAIY